jgi:uncharacterized coiled-coil protein SlyX
VGSPLRDLLGITALARRIDRLEKNMATAKDQIAELRGTFTDFAADVDARLDQLLAAQGTLNAEAQAEFDALKQAVADADAKVGDADGSDTPPAEDPDNPNI